MVNFKRLKAERVAHGKTQDEVAEFMGISLRSYKNKENGYKKSVFNMHEFDKYLDCIGIEKQEIHIFFD